MGCYVCSHLFCSIRNTTQAYFPIICSFKKNKKVVVIFLWNFLLIEYWVPNSESLPSRDTVPLTMPACMLELWTERIMQLSLLLARKGQLNEKSNTFQWKGRALYPTRSLYSELYCASYCVYIALSEANPSASFSQAEATFPQIHFWKWASLPNGTPGLCSKVERCSLTRYWPSLTPVSP